MMFKSQSFRGNQTAKRAVFAALIIAAFLAGTVANNQLQSAQAEPNRDGFSNQIIEISSGVTRENPVVVYALPDSTSEKLDTLLWGDRVLYRGVEQTDPAGVRWREVDLAEGITGWITASLDDLNTKRLVISDAVFTTPGIGVGVAITVSADGAGANLRENPSVAATRVRKLTAGETLTVVAGPYQAEYFVWWQVQDTSGALGWVVDIQAWFTAATPAQ